MNTSGKSCQVKVKPEKGFTITLQETLSIHDQ